MANYRLVSNATFRPFSFEEYVKPYQMYGEAYKEIETNIVDLETQAGKWDKLANEQSDPKTHATYKAYADELRAQAEQLARYGMSPDLRRRAATMKSRYAKEIEPIEIQYNKREQMRERQHQEQVASHGTLMFDNDFNNVSLDKMLENPNMTYNFVSGEQLTSDAAAMIQAIALDKGDSIEIKDADGSPMNKEKKAFFLQSIKRKGLALEDIEKAINGDADANPIITGVINKINEANKDNPAYNKDKALPHIAKGMRTGVLGSETALMQHPNTPSDMDIRRQDFTEWHGRQDVAIAKQNANTNAYNAKTNRMQASMSMLATYKGLSKQDVEMEAMGKVWDKKTKSYREMTNLEKSRSTPYLATQDKEGQRKAMSISNSVIGYVSIPANVKGRSKIKGGSPVIKTRTPAQVQSLINNGAGVFTYNEYGSSVGAGCLAPHAQREIATQLKKWGPQYKPEHFIYVVPSHKTGDAAEAILIPVELLPELELKNK